MDHLCGCNYVGNLNNYVVNGMQLYVTNGMY